MTQRRDQTQPPRPDLVLRPTPLSLAAWLSYVPAVVFVTAGARYPLFALLLAAPWILAANGLFRGARWAWILALATAGMNGVFALAPFLARTAEPPPPGLVRTTLASLAFFAVYLACLLAPSTRRFIRTGRRD